MVGAEPVIWMVNEGEAVTETADITESTSTDVFLQFTKVTPLTLPLITTVVFLQPYRLTMWLISPFSTVSSGSFSWYSMTHLLPSRANLAGFLVESDWGFAGLVGFLPGGGEVLLGTVEEARKAGFLCVISLFSTFTISSLTTYAFTFTFTIFAFLAVSFSFIILDFGFVAIYAPISIVINGPPLSPLHALLAEE